MANTYPIVANCNFESRNDVTGKAIHAARKALESGLTHDSELTEAMDTLEETLTEHADSQYVDAIEACREAEQTVADAWAKVADTVDAERQSRYVD